MNARELATAIHERQPLSRLDDEWGHADYAASVILASDCRLHVRTPKSGRLSISAVLPYAWQGKVSSLSAGEITVSADREFDDINRDIIRRLCPALATAYTEGAAKVAKADDDASATEAAVADMAAALGPRARTYPRSHTERATVGIWPAERAGWWADFETMNYRAGQGWDIKATSVPTATALKIAALLREAAE